MRLWERVRLWKWKYKPWPRGRRRISLRLAPTRMSELWVGSSPGVHSWDAFNEYDRRISVMVIAWRWSFGFQAGRLLNGDVIDGHYVGVNLGRIGIEWSSDRFGQKIDYGDGADRGEST